MKIVIPMAGNGRRFVQAGYTIPKPLLKIEGKPMICHVIDMFPGETDFVFICNEEHLKNTDMKKVLSDYCPTGKIVSIEKVEPLGPVWGTQFAFDHIGDDEEVVVNYCDVNIDWNYEDFKNKIKETKCDGAQPAFRGFHPSTLANAFFAYIKWAEDNKLLEVREKQAFTDNRMNEFASTGTYYFNKGKYVKKYFLDLMKKKMQVNGEYYVSMVYNLMNNDGLKSYIYEIEHFLDWGTPQALEDYKSWSEHFTARVKDPDKAKGLVFDTKGKMDTFFFWRDYFHKAKDHPYDKERDLLAEQIATLIKIRG